MALGRLALTFCLLVVPLAMATPPLAAPCSPIPGAVADTGCAPIHPGGKVLTPAGQCTFNFVVTDGVDLFIGTAGHCVRAGDRVRVPGHAEVGTVALDGRGGDWAFVRIDAAARPLVDPTLATWGGPTGARLVVPGEPLLHHGHGASLGQVDATRARPAAAIVGTEGSRTFWFAGSVDYGDSGSPVASAATGEALGIAVATFLPGPAPALAIATRFDLAMAELASSLGKPVSIVEGRAFVQPLSPASV